MCSRFDTIRAIERQTDRQTDGSLLPLLDPSSSSSVVVVVVVVVVIVEVVEEEAAVVVVLSSVDV